MRESAPYQEYLRSAIFYWHYHRHPKNPFGKNLLSGFSAVGLGSNPTYTHRLDHRQFIIIDRQTDRSDSKIISKTTPSLCSIYTTISLSTSNVLEMVRRNLYHCRKPVRETTYVTMRRVYKRWRKSEKKLYAFAWKTTVATLASHKC